MKDTANKIIAQLFHNTALTVGDTFLNATHSKEVDAIGLGFHRRTRPSLSVWTYLDRVDYCLNGEHYSIPL